MGKIQLEITYVGKGAFHGYVEPVGSDAYDVTGEYIIDWSAKYPRPIVFIAWRGEQQLNLMDLDLDLIQIRIEQWCDAGDWYAERADADLNRQAESARASSDGEY